MVPAPARRINALLGALLVALAACGPAPGAAPSSIYAGSPAPSTANSSVAASATNAASGYEWLVVTFGDSFADPSGWPMTLAEMVAADRGGMATVGGFSCRGGCGGLEVGRFTSQPGVAADLANADLIVIQPQPGFNVLPFWRSYTAGECGGSDSRECIRQSGLSYRTYVNELLDAVLQLAPRETAIRVVLANAHGVRMWTGSGMDFTFDLQAVDPDLFDVFVDQYRQIMRQAAEAAAERCIPVWDANAFFLGPDYRGHYPPRYTSDGAHPSAEANRLIAEHLLALGNDPHSPGCEAGH
jgi:hypothetical protein